MHSRRLAALMLFSLAASPSFGDSNSDRQPPGEPFGVRPFDVQGHRGARGLLPENTLEGFHRAMELGVSTLELDLGVTRDREVVVSHDRRINPMVCRRADGTRILTPALLRELSLAEVQALDCGGLNPDSKRFPEPPRDNVPGARIPTLRQVFELARSFGDDQVRFNVEIKIDPTVDDTVPIEEFVTLVIGVVREQGLSSRVTFQSFDWRALKLAKQHAPDLETAALLTPETIKPEWMGGLDPKAHGGTSLGLLRAAQDYVDVYSPYWRLIAPHSPLYLGSRVAEIQAAGFSVVPWTVNTKRRMSKMIALGVDGLITDYPDILIALLQERSVPIR